MRSKLVLAAALVATLALPITAASARGFGGFGGHGGFGGGHFGFGGFHGGFGGFRGGFGGFYRPYFFPRPYYAGLYGSPCWRPVWTPWGFHRRWVCGYSGYGYPYSYY
jgi:hypothetical protein